MYSFKQYVIKKLSFRPQLRDQSDEEDAVKVRGKTLVNNLQYLKPFPKRQDSYRRRKLAQRKASDLLLKRLISTVQSGLLHGLFTLDEDLPDSSDDEDEKSLSSKAKKAARNIFNNVAKEGSHVIVLDDLKKYMRADKASLAMHLFKGTAGIEGITEESFTHWMTEAVKERRFLQLSLSDSKTAWMNYTI